MRFESNGGHELQDEDWCTDDYQEWWQHGARGRFFTNQDGWGEQLKAKMDADRFWPNCWYVCERGEHRLLDVEKETFATFASEEIQAAIAEYEELLEFDNMLEQDEHAEEERILDLVYA